MKHEYIREINTEHFTADNEQEFTEYFRIKNVWGCTKIYSKKLFDELLLKDYKEIKKLLASLRYSETSISGENLNRILHLAIIAINSLELDNETLRKEIKEKEEVYTNFGIRGEHLKEQFIHKLNTNPVSVLNTFAPLFPYLSEPCRDAMKFVLANTESVISDIKTAELAQEMDNCGCSALGCDLLSEEELAGINETDELSYDEENNKLEKNN